MPELTTRIQRKPEPSIEGNRFTAPQLLATDLHYVIVLADGEPVAQQGFFHRGTRWWVDDLFVHKDYRGTEVTYVLREATFKAVAERSSEFYSYIEHAVAKPERVLNDPIKIALGVVVEEKRRGRNASKYRYDVSALQTKKAG